MSNSTTDDTQFKTLFAAAIRIYEDNLRMTEAIRGVVLHDSPHIANDMTSTAILLSVMV